MATKQILNLKRTIGEINARGLSRRTLEPIAVDLRKTILNRIKAGFGVVSDRVAESTGRRLKPLSESYKRQRARNGVRGERGTPNRSNLTNTGQMLDSLRSIAKRGQIVLDIPDTSRKGSSATNKEVAGYVRKDRPFLALTKKEARQLNRDVTRQVDLAIKRALKG